MAGKLSGNNKVVNYKKMAEDGMYNLKTVVARGAINYVYMNSYDNRFNIKRRKVYQMPIDLIYTEYDIYQQQQQGLHSPTQAKKEEKRAIPQL